MTAPDAQGEHTAEPHAGVSSFEPDHSHEPRRTLLRKAVHDGIDEMMNIIDEAGRQYDSQQAALGEALDALEQFATVASGFLIKLNEHDFQGDVPAQGEGAELDAAIGAAATILARHRSAQREEQVG